MFSFGWLDPSSLAWWLPSAYAAFVGIFYAYVWLRWGRREQRGRKGKSSKAEAGATSLREPLLNADVLADEEEEEEANGGDWADVEQLHIPAGSASGQPQQPLAATGMLWITQSLSYAIFLFRGVEAALSVAGVVESCSICNAALALAWLTMILCRSADHWSRARSPPPPPQRLKMNIWLWPFYNLSFVLSLVSLLSDRHAISLADTGMLAVVAEGLCLLSVSASLLRGADVQWLEDPLNEEFQAGLASAAFFDWFTEYVMKGQRKQLDLEDLPQQMSLDRTKAVWSKFSSSAASKPLLLRLFLLVRPLVIAQGAWQFIAVITELTGPLAMQNIVNFISEYKHGDSVPASVNFFVSLLLLGPLVQGVADGRNFHLGRRIGCRVRSALVNAIFLKTLKTDMSASTYSSGELVNLMSVDAQSALEMAPYMHYIWTTALQIAVCIGLLFYVLGVASLGGVAFMIISIPVGKWTASRQQSYQKQLMSKKDARMGVVGETLQGMRIVKLFAWESYFLRQVEEKRRDEMYVLRRYLIMMAGVIVQWNSVTTLVGLCTFVVHTRVLGRSLSASQGFTALSLFNILRFPLLVLPDVFNFLFQSYVSLKRVESFLGRNEIEGLAEEGGAAQSTPLGMLPGSVSVADASFSWGHPPPAASSTEAAAEPAVDSSKPPGQQTNGAQAASAPTDDVEVAWPLLYDDSGSPTSSASSSAVSDEAGSSSPTVSSPESGKITLTDINLEAGPGQLLCIYGVTGGGKSSLLLGILGEIRKLKGSVNLCGSIAYCSQRAWIQNATVRDNILFGLPFEQDHYTRVIRACALESDLELLEHGDETEIGEKGINLSGGQQQRVSLARALYSNADIYLLDDVLSAVDAHVGEHIFRKCIRHELLRRGKTVILVSHSIALTAKHADQAVIIERGGKIAESGPPTKLLEDPDSMLSLLVQKLGGGGGDRLMRQSSNVVDDLQTLLEAPDKEGGGKSIASKLIKEEERAKGAPGLGIYRAYVAACGGPISFLAPYLVLHVSYNAMAFAQNLSLSNWVTVLEDDKPDGRAMWTYIIVSFAVIVAIFGRSLFQSLASLKASVHLHDSMAARIMRAPMGWFETTPTGRILNRFASDMQEIDKNAMEEFGSTLACFFSVASIVLVISYTAPYLIIGLVPVSALSWFIGQLYLNASRELKRLDSVSKSPIYSHFTESVNGVSTIRAFGAQKRFVAESGRRVDCCNRAHFNLWVANRWFNIRVQIVGGVVALLAGGFLVYWGKDHIPAATSGLALLYALQFTDAVKYLVREHANLEMKMNSVERALEYMNVPQEKPASIEERKPPASWPARGEICVRDLTLQYPSANTPVIQDMSFTIPAGTRVGIVGRTGAGKSSMCSVLFRIVEPMAGSITIDGVDVLSIGLEDLRSRLSIVPQDPILFHGTIRSNLDPYEKHTDAEIWQALKQAHLGQAVDSLSDIVSENGNNFSVGQRQLVCMARALLRNSSILFLDEATASIDVETDAGIQDMIKNGFEHATIITIAHRIATIAYYDKVMVLEKGRLIEYDSPAALLDDETTMFYSLCAKTGSLEELKALAQESSQG